MSPLARSFSSGGAGLSPDYDNEVSSWWDAGGGATIHVTPGTGIDLRAAAAATLQHDLGTAAWALWDTTYKSITLTRDGLYTVWGTVSLSVVPTGGLWTLSWGENNGGGGLSGKTISGGVRYSSGIFRGNTSDDSYEVQQTIVVRAPYNICPGNFYNGAQNGMATPIDAQIDYLDIYIDKIG